MAKLYFIYGTMNCGKSTKVLQDIHSLEANGKKIVLLKPSIDTKGNNKVISRIGLERQVDHLVDKDTDIPSLLMPYEDLYGVFVDEAQFLTKEQVDDLLLFTIRHNKPVMCYGLKTNFLGELFKGSKRLLECSSKITEMKTICSCCGNKAIFSARFIGGVFCESGQEVSIDTNHHQEYKPLCANCYISLKH